MYTAFWPDAIAMVAIGALALRSTGGGKWPFWGVVTTVASIALASLYRVLPSGVAPPIHEQIGPVGWLATILTASIPLIAVVLTGLRARRSHHTTLARGFRVAAAGLVALLAYPLYGMFFYCGLTGICP